MDDLHSIRKRSHAIMLSKRANVFVLEHAKVFMKGNRIVYAVADGEDIERLFNIPEKNTIFILLGRGCSISDAAVRAFTDSNTLVGFCGSGGSPLFACADPVFLPSVSEYRPTEYMQSWARMFFDERKRIETAKEFIYERVRNCLAFWKVMGLETIVSELSSAKDELLKRTEASQTTEQILAMEGTWTKRAYACFSKHYGMTDFGREHGQRNSGTAIELTNSFLDHGNYLAYGFSASVLNTLGISFAFPVLHGKTRRGALVFDVADLFKDALVLPLAFKAGAERHDETRFRASVIESCIDNDICDRLFSFIKTICNQSVTQTSKKH